MKLLKVEPLTDRGNVRALVEVETPDGETITCRIVKQDGFRAYLAPPEGITFTHKEKRHLQREAVKVWGDQIGDTLPGLLESEKVFKGSRFHCLGITLKAFCPVPPACRSNRHRPGRRKEKNQYAGLRRFSRCDCEALDT